MAAESPVRLPRAAQAVWISEALKVGMSIAAIGERLGISAKVVRQICDEHKLPRPMRRKGVRRGPCGRCGRPWVMLDSSGQPGPHRPILTAGDGSRYYGEACR